MLSRRAFLPWRPLARLLGPRPGRGYATTKQPSATTHFYKTFTRPVAKTTLLAVFTYQIVYWGWAKLEADELCAEMDATIADLEAQVRALGAARVSEDGKEKQSNIR